MSSEIRIEITPFTLPSTCVARPRRGHRRCRRAAAAADADATLMAAAAAAATAELILLYLV